MYSRISTVAWVVLIALIASVVPPTAVAAKGKTSSSRVRKLRVVLDPGHGGHDTGAIGAKKVREKDVVLAIARETAEYLEATGIEVILTRRGDASLSLSERTEIANRAHADLFVSIHANSARNTAANGIETYYLNVTSNRYAMRLAALENQTSEKEVGDLQLILADLSTKVNTRESLALAERVQKRLLRAARTAQPSTRDLGVKGALFYVLLGARMPAILIETAFVSNPAEARQLTTTAHQRRLGQAIAEAIREHLKAPIQVVQP